MLYFMNISLFAPDLQKYLSLSLSVSSLSSTQVIFIFLLEIIL